MNCADFKAIHIPTDGVGIFALPSVLTLWLYYHTIITDGGALCTAVNNKKRMIDLNEKDMRSFGDARLTDNFPLAMAYVRRQRLDKMYPPETALERGTLFPELDKPFCGRTVMGGRR